MRSRGFSLIEILIAIVVLSSGMLGAAAMLLASLQGQAQSQREIAALNLLRDVADRIRVNRQGRAAYARPAAAPDCGAQACNAEQLAAADRAYFASAARALFSDDIIASIEFAPATGPSSPDHYVLTLGPARASPGGPGVVSLQVLLRAPVAG
jgi:type IV pilus modification protein PilV